MKSNPEFDAFNAGMDKLLKANPQIVMRRDTEAAFYKRCDEEDAGGRL